MFKHTFILAYRSFLRYKSTFFINLIGLSTGLAGALLIYLWVSDELAVNKFHAKDSQLYQVMNNLKTATNISTLNITPGPLAALVKEMPEVEYAVAVNDFSSWRTKEGILSVEEIHLPA